MRKLIIILVQQETVNLNILIASDCNPFQMP